MELVRRSAQLPCQKLALPRVVPCHKNRQGSRSIRSARGARLSCFAEINSSISDIPIHSSRLCNTRSGAF